MNPPEPVPSRVARVLVWVGVAALAGVLVASMLRHSYFRDELQCVHAAWNVSQGQVPYRDFWENHTPLTYWALQPWIRLLPRDDAFLVTTRLTYSLPLALAMLAIIAGIARARSLDATWTGVAVLFAASNPFFLARAAEVRPDHLLWLGWFGGLWLLLRHARRGAAWIGAGACFALALWSSPKLALGLTALAATLAVHAFLRPVFDLPAGGRTLLSRAGLLAAGFTAVSVPVIAGFAACGGLSALGYWIVAFNFGTSTSYWVTPRQLLDPAMAVVPLLAATSLVLRPASPGAPALTGLGLLLLFQFCLPRANDYTTVLFMPLLAVAAAETLQALARHRPAMSSRAGRLAATLVLAASFAIAPMAVKRLAGMSETNVANLAEDRAFQADLLRLSAPGDPIVDGYSHAMFRPSPYFFGILGAILEGEHARGRLPAPGIPTMVDAIERTHPKFVVEDWRIRRAMNPQTIVWIKERYVPACRLPGLDEVTRARFERQRVLVAGAELPQALFDAAGRATWAAWAPGRYVAVVEGAGATISIDGRPSTEGFSVRRGQAVALRAEGTFDKLWFFRVERAPD